MNEVQSSSLILASGSAIRRKLLENAGFEFEVVTSDVDEGMVREAFLGDGGGEVRDVAEVLALAKAENVSSQHGGALVIGADQVMVFEGRCLEKPSDMEEARDRLLALRGKTHELVSAVAVARNGETLWQVTDVAYLTVRDFEPEWLGRYLAKAGRQVLSSVGAYQFEGLGAHLFDKVEGDYFTILGIPLLPLISYLSDTHGVSL